MIGHFLTYFIARGLPGIINFLAIFLYSRLLAPEQYGKYAIILAAAALINAFLLSWLRLGVLRYYPSYNEHDRKRFLSTVLVAFGAYSAVSGLLVFAASLFGVFDSGYSTIWLLGLCLLWVSGFFEINLEIFRADLSPKSYGLFYASKAVLTLTVSLAIIWFFHLGAGALVAGSIAASLIPLAVVMPKVWRGLDIRLFDWTILRQLLVYGLPLTLTQTMAFIIDSSDRLLLGWLSGTAAAGLYAVTYDFAQQTIILMMTIVNLAAYPLIIHAMEKGRMAEVKNRMEQNIVYLLAIALPAAGGMAILSGNLSGIFFGEAYREAASLVIPWIAIVSLVQGFKVFYLDLAFQLSKQTSKQIVSVLSGSLLNIVLNVWWIPIYGIKGALAATAAAYAVSSLMSWQLGKAHFSLPFPKREVLKVGASTGIMLAALYPVHTVIGPVALMLQVLLGLLVYGSCIWLFNVLDVRSAVNIGWFKLKVKG
ncbi:oligosaccharide flippase family protein [Domibacillus sp. DTU_2020_1001157_1_SI_ALB_TIR_016]|uniref:lipopolysaccharide biosynthesis protein n=1 Tax=Domibacillus sp. DTU_2020_1001157_1_SI_ALB_TIR_016 TaxID=3077789 RepID=UPI0028E47714|nr:oligosaccharide flippase family protein [Domibacillus sp. DTU_2020_1001157_1_SI_ALB_TIR_016]WNS81207.1 oligosaccharide flippase family protein [Domibacillus sp. DTU_2020_1001157_1_SI_ALB_TIR_016]